MSGAAARPVMLLGAQRSGTTAMASVLDRALDDVGGVFTINGKLPYLLHRWCRPSDLRARHLRADEILAALDRKPAYGRHAEAWRAQAESALRRAAAEVARGGHDDAPALRRRIVEESYAGSSRFGEKYNEYLLELDDLAATVPDAVWILLIRHPAEVAGSMVSWRGDRPWCPREVPDAMAKWASWHEDALHHPWVLDPGRTVVVDYDDVCGGDGLARIGAAIGLDLAPYADGLSRRPRPDHAPELPAPVARTWHRLRELRPAGDAASHAARRPVPEPR